MPTFNPIPELTESQIINFWNKVKFGSKCWIWTGIRRRDGYGAIPINQKMYVSTRVAYKLTHGNCPVDKMICHTCDNPPCVNPTHLVADTHIGNMKDMTSKKREARGIRHGSVTHPNSLPRGSKHHKAKLIEEEVIHIKQLLAAGESCNSVHEIYKDKVSKSLISDINRGIIWKHITI